MADTPGVAFVRLALACDALAFGEFTLKSGRRSPYFLNVGKFTGATEAAELGRLYAAVISAVAPEGATLVGLPYKGIPLAALACAALASSSAAPYSYRYLRKETKDHGEGGLLVGGPLPDGGKVLLIDDVLTAGTAVREYAGALEGMGARAAGLVVAFDRGEAARPGGAPASVELAEGLGIAVHAVASKADMLELVSAEHATTIRSYQEFNGST